MRKLALDADELRVESFHVTAAADGKGTVFGEQCTCYTNCTCPGCPTCDETCADTCGATCGDSCALTCDPVECGFTGGPTCLMSCNGKFTCLC